MARDGISGLPLPAAFPYWQIFQDLCMKYEVAPCLVGAIKVNESGLTDPPDVMSGDGGHGLMQLTSSWPENWADPATNIEFAIVNFILPDWRYWDQYLQGDGLVRAIAASYNAGLGNAIAGHEQGNLDLYTTDNYAARALANYYQLAAGTLP
jgi:hypothetical protein